MKKIQTHSKPKKDHPALVVSVLLSAFAGGIWASTRISDLQALPVNPPQTTFIIPAIVLLSALLIIMYVVLTKLNV